MLTVENVEVVYNDVVLVLRGVSLEVPERAIVALLGANGAGKTTLLRAITGLLKPHRGVVTKGHIRFGGTEIHQMAASKIVSMGISQVLEGRRIFPELSVDENLTAGAANTSRRQEALARDRVYEMFPKLADLRRHTAGYLSGGEQQMLAIGRGLMAGPKLLLLDEPSLGLAPIVQEQVRQVIVDINRDGTAVLLVEQNAAMALQIAEHGYVMEVGRVVLDGPAAELRENADVKEFYLGMGAEGSRRSFRDVKQYRRRKRWLS